MENQTLLPNLDPDNKEFLRRLNSYFCEEIKDATDLNSIELMWYLRTVLIGHEEVCDALREMYKPLHLSRGLSVMVSETGNYLCLQPRLKDRSRTAWEIWVTHTEDVLKDRIAERLVTKGD